MDPADKFYIFCKVCVWITILLAVLNITSIISISWLIVFVPVGVPAVIILKELGV